MSPGFAENTPRIVESKQGRLLAQGLTIAGAPEYLSGRVGSASAAER